MLLLSAIPGPTITYVSDVPINRIIQLADISYICNLIVIFILGMVFITAVNKINKKLVVLNWVVAAIMTAILLIYHYSDVAKQTYHLNATFISILLICYMILIKVLKNEGNVSKKKKIIGISIAIHVILQAIIIILFNPSITLEKSIITTITYSFWLIEIGLVVSNFIVATRKNKQIN